MCIDVDTHVEIHVLHSYYMMRITYATKAHPYTYTSSIQSNTRFNSHSYGFQLQNEEIDLKQNETKRNENLHSSVHVCCGWQKKKLQENLMLITKSLSIATTRRQQKTKFFIYKFHLPFRKT